MPEEEVLQKFDGESVATKSVFHFVMIKPTHYDDDGYPIQWMRSAIPSNTLATLNGLAVAAVKARALGPDVEVKLHTFDETNRRIRPEKIIRMIEKDGEAALIGFVGVQSNQFPRSMDLARIFRASGLQVAIGGFHVSGCLAMLKDLPPELAEAQQLGISLFAGEAEDGRLVNVLRDAYRGELKPIYNYMNDLPGLQDQPTPILPSHHVGRTAGAHTSFDLGRGCPYQCSFCTIINVQGHKSRFRSADDLEGIIRENYAQGINRFFITDDNFARNRAWENMFDRMIELRERDKLDIKFIIQVDTLCHKIDRFIEKATRAGVNRVFIGLENINPDNLIAAKKKQNKITEYRDMLQEWRRYGATTYAGYIIGFPGDTKESVLRDVEIIKKELPLDLLEFFYLTPLPGSEDHKVLAESGAWLDPDLNKYDLNHRVSKHPVMSDKEWDEAYRAAWEAYYTPEHMATILKRAAAHRKGRPGNKLFLMCWFYFMLKFEGIHPLEGGYFRLKFRRDRRPDLPREAMLPFYARYGLETVKKHIQYVLELGKIWPAYRKIKKAEDRYEFSDLAIKAIGDNEEATLGIYNKTRGGKEEVERLARQQAIIESARASR